MIEGNKGWVGGCFWGCEMLVRAICSNVFGVYRSNMEFLERVIHRVTQRFVWVSEYIDGLLNFN